MYAHRFSWELAYGPIPAGMCVCHICDNPSCVRPSHLFLGTQADNMRDMDIKGRGRDNRKILTEAQITAIRKDNRLQREIAADYGVDQSTINKIKRGHTYRRVS